MMSQGYHAVCLRYRHAYSYIIQSSIEKLQVDRVFAKMSKRCVAAGCSNTYKSGVSLFLFLKTHSCVRIGQIRSRGRGTYGKDDSIIRG